MSQYLAFTVCMKMWTVNINYIKNICYKIRLYEGKTPFVDYYNTCNRGLIKE